MPYCPKCDMEFVDGITTCSDCGGYLVESKEVAQAMKKKEQQEAMARQQEEYEAMQAALAADASGDAEIPETGSNPAEQMRHAAESYAGRQLYVKKAQKYDDLKSSASAFLLVGGGLLVLSVLCWTGIIRLPMAGPSLLISQSVMTLLGIGSLIVAAASAKSAKAISGQIDEEEATTRQLIEWFTENYTGSQLDSQILAESGELLPEELSLKRFSLIQDILVTTYDIADQGYVDLIAEDIYGKMYQD